MGRLAEYVGKKAELGELGVAPITLLPADVQEKVYAAYVEYCRDGVLNESVHKIMLALRVDTQELDRKYDL